MSTSRSTRRPGSNLPGIKMLIAAASLAVTVGGWAVLTAKEASSTPAATVAQTQVPSDVTLDLPPLPTVVPPPKLSVPPPTSQRLASRIAPPPSSSLRVVPPPVTITRSSR